MPANITSKELTVIQEQMDAEFRANRKAAAYARSLSDPQLAGFANTLAQHHKARFDALYSFIAN
ncbi:hypothetical protein FACS18948_7240 [Clostridia bacterium]|nr:hypothetical protein FACS18948_7240 [Clostridia bacterium]